MVLIETYWNVNTALYTALTAIETVLIETYWNVNVFYFGRLRRSYKVLIETYWNVNILILFPPFADFLS